MWQKISHETKKFSSELNNPDRKAWTQSGSLNQCSENNSEEKVSNIDDYDDSDVVLMTY